MRKDIRAGMLVAVSLIAVSGTLLRTDRAGAAAGPPGAAAVQVNLTVVGGDVGDGAPWEIDLYNGFNCSGAPASSRATSAVGDSSNGSVTFPLVGGNPYSLEIAGNPARVTTPYRRRHASPTCSRPAGYPQGGVTVTKNASPVGASGGIATPAAALTNWKKVAGCLIASGVAGLQWGGYWAAVPPWGAIGGGVVTVGTDVAAALLSSASSRYPRGVRGDNRSRRGTVGWVPGRMHRASRVRPAWPGHHVALRWYRRNLPGGH